MISLCFLPCLTQLSRSASGRSACLLVALFLTSCSSANTSISHTTPTTPANTVIATAGPAPVTAPLAPPPQNCPLRPPPQKQHLDHLGMNTDVQLVGGGAFWIYGGYYQSILHLAQNSSQQWPMTKIVVEVGPNYSQPVTLRLREIRTGTLAWWTDAQTPPHAATQILVLNSPTDTADVGATPPYSPDVSHGSPDPGWKEWGIFPLFSVAGCYTLEVSWSGGSWQSNIAVGN